MQFSVNISALLLFLLKIESSDTTGCTRVKLIFCEVAQNRVSIKYFENSPYMQYL